MHNIGKAPSSGKQGPVGGVTPPPSQVSWSQTEDDVEVVIDLPEGVKARDISLTIKSNLVTFGLKNGFTLEENELPQNITDKNGPKNQPSLLTQLKSGMTPFHSIDAEVSAWTLESGQLVITLGKRDTSEKDWAQLAR